ncbi:MAG: monofunctional biosynthetic peptidoglycan transglycosylase, partial [Proteobacteria bacterium]|nr:monofunctional biosynthetic peptidoglycan transglycosylase [Pseudomonadota bacterium]
MIRCLRWFKRGLLFLVLALLLYHLWLFGWVLYWKWFNPDTTSFMAIRLSELRVKQPQAQLKKQWAPYAQISVHLKRALIASEDGKFVEHGGFDWEGIQHAIKRNEKKGRFVAGGST